MSVRVIKLCLLGGAGVGKSSLVTKFVDDSFPASIDLDLAVGAVPMFKTLVVGHTSYKFQIWDIPGNEKLARVFAPKHYRDAAAAIVVYDVTSQKSFQTLKDWIRELKQYGSDNIVLAIAGNKCDLDSWRMRMVKTDEAMTYAEENNAIFLETSAQTAHNVSELFTLITQKLPPETPTLSNDSTCSESTKLLEKSTSATGNCCMCM
ncbi:ras-related protein Rab-31-like [Branchiostoma floridae x Branchiostoma japonicum]